MTYTRFTRVASWHRICFIDLGEPPAVVSQGLLATRCMLAVTPSRGACAADFSSLHRVPLRTGYHPRSYPRPSHPGRPCNACVAPLEPQPSPPSWRALGPGRRPSPLAGGMRRGFCGTTARLAVCWRRDGISSAHHAGANTPTRSPPSTKARAPARSAQAESP